MGMESAGYSGDEAGIEWSAGASPPRTGDSFEVRPPQIVPEAAPLVDEVTGFIAGYRYYSGGFWMIWDLEGNLVETGELPLEAPLIDPIDLLSGGLTALLRGLGGGVLRGVGRGVVAGAARSGLRSLSTRTVMALHTVLRKLIQPGSLKFTVTTVERMANPGRYVPIHILHLAIRHGKQLPDPQGVLGAVKYVAPMWKNGKQYMLEVVVRAHDTTVLHFLYK